MAEARDPYPQIVLASTDPDLPPKLPVGVDKYNDFEPMARGIKTELRSCWDCVMGRKVAMKTLRSEFSEDVDERRRFLREARVTAQLQHPNTVPVYEIGRDVDNSLYFTMKCIAGEDLFKVMQRLSWDDLVTIEKFPRDRLIDILIQAMQSLAYAHAHGVIHRDIKPENIWVGDFAEVIVLDWGVAKVWGVEDTDEGPELIRDIDQELSPLTLDGQRPGTPLYMSPEQVLGHLYLDERTDIFSMGVVLYELLTFKEPFRGRTVRQTFDRIINEEPTAPRQVAPARDIPKSLERIALKAIAKKPEDRYQSAVEMIDDLDVARRQLLSGQ